MTCKILSKEWSQKELIHKDPAKNNIDLLNSLKQFTHKNLIILGRIKRKIKNQNAWLCVCKCSINKRLVFTTKQLRYSPFACCEDCAKKKMLSQILENTKPSKTGCIIYQGFKNADGYGMIWFNNRDGKRSSTLAHRMVYRLKKNIEDETLQVCHKCDNPSCINIDHLFLGTAKDNVHDMLQKKRGNHAHGEKNGNSKLTREIVRKIKRTTKKLSEKEIVEKFHISKSTYYRIKNNKTWFHKK